jgi:hypothetical protein
MLNVRISGAQTFPYSETDVRVDFSRPCRIIAAANEIETSPDMQVSQGQFCSWDGGQTWRQTSLPLNPGDDLQADPSVEWTSDGTAWAVTIGYDFSGATLRLRSFKSTDGGATWTYDGDVSGDQTNADRERIWVDHSPTSPFKDNMYVIWHNNQPVFVNRRIGPSGSWQTPLQVSASETTGVGIGGDIAANSAGDVFAFWVDAGSQSLYVAKSIDGAAAFGLPVSIASTFATAPVLLVGAIPSDDFRGAFMYVSGAAFGTAKKNLVYAMWMDLSGEDGCTSGYGPGEDLTSTCKTRIWFSRSTDGGATWEAARMINNQPSLNDQFHPRMAVDDTSGMLIAIYYDSVRDPGRRKTDVWMQCSSDDGVTWSDAERVTFAQTDETVTGADFGNQYGDYIGLSGICGGFFATWVDRRNGGHEEIWGAPVGPVNSFPIIELIATTC